MIEDIQRWDMKRREFLIGSCALLSMPYLSGDATAQGGQNLNQELQSSTVKSAFPTVEPDDIGVNSDKVGELLTFLRDTTSAHGIPGFALVATHRDQCFLEHFEGTYCGVAQKQTPLSREVLHRAFSFTKPVSATVVMQLHEEKLLDVDLPVQAYIPEFKGGGKDKITVRNFMSHAAGLPSVGMYVPTEEKWQEALSQICNAEVEWEPGSKTHYHALSSLFVPAAVARIVTGNTPWQELCQKRLFEPLGMSNSYFAMPTDESLPVAITPQPDTAPASWHDANFDFIGHPAGGMLITTEDILRFMNMHLNRGLWHGRQIINETTWQDMQRVVYQAEIDAAYAANQQPTHEYWASGWLTRGTTDSGWFGFGANLDKRSFGHAGINTVIGIADPSRALAFAFITSDSPPNDESTVLLRNTTSNLLAEATPVINEVN